MTHVSTLSDKEKGEFALHFSLMNLSIVIAVMGLLTIIDFSPVSGITSIVLCGAGFLQMIYFIWRFGNVVINSSGWLIYLYKVLVPVATLGNGFMSLYLFKMLFPFLGA